MSALLKGLVRSIKLWDSVTHEIRFQLPSFFLPSFGQAAYRLCGSITIEDGKIKLSASEKVLVCGSNKSEIAWRDIPLTQAQYQLNTILQNLGYLNARFELEGNSLKVWKGLVTEFKHLILTGTNGVVNVKKKRKVVGEAITPQKLDEVKTWAELAARRKGHACPHVAVNAEVWNRTLFANIEPGPEQTIGSIDRTGYGALEPETLTRFEAFEAGRPYNVIETQITADRLMAQGLFQNAYITAACHDDKVDLHFVTEVGKRRLLRFSVGASTEEFPFADVWFKHSRLDNRASAFTAKLHTSPRRQTFDLTSEFYVIPNSYRTYLGPRLKLERRYESAYETNKAEIGGDIGRGWDIPGVRIDGRVGPTYNYARTVSGQGPTETTYLSWEGKLDASSHAYEAFSRTQVEGWTASFNYSGQRKGLGSDLKLDRFDLRYKYLYNYKGFSPPLLVLASRFEAITIDTHKKTPDEIVDIPIDLRIYYGGNENIRGFTRESLNNYDRGYLSAALASFELRLIETVPYHIEPFLLWDTAKLGDGGSTFIDPTFMSYGAGVRWASPFGTLRGSAAKGDIINSNSDTNVYPQEWVYFVSFGQEF